jgi:hypothetical protein
VEASREAAATTSSAATTAHAASKAAAAHLSTKHLEEHLGVDLRAHTTAHATETTTTELFRGVNEILTAVITSALLGI